MGWLGDWMDLLEAYTMKIVQFANHWSVRDSDDNRLSHWFLSEVEALTELQNIEQGKAQMGLFS